MANRHLSRSIVLQTLFEWDFNREQTAVFDWKSALERNKEEFASGHNDDSFMVELFDLVVRKQKVIDDIIMQAAPEWPIEKINPIDRAILRIGLAELVFGDRENVPPKVAINEAIELAKTFGGEKSGKFINGVLGAVYKELGQPGKEQEGKKKKIQIENIPDDLTPIEVKSGGVVFARHEGAIYFALVHDVFGYWTLSKGGVEALETPESAAVREIQEEMGLATTVVEYLDETTYIAFDPQKGKIRKNVKYFLLEATYQPITLEKGSGGLNDAKWFSMQDVVDIHAYENVYGLITKAIEHLTA